LASGAGQTSCLLALPREPELQAERAKSVCLYSALASRLVVGEREVFSLRIIITSFAKLGTPKGRGVNKWIQLLWLPVHFRWLPPRVCERRLRGDCGRE